MGRPKKQGVDYAKMCKGCIYYRLTDGFSTDKCCHHLLDTGMARKRDADGNCLSKILKKRRGRAGWAK